MLTLEDILRKAGSYLPDLDQQRLRTAYEYAEKAHKDSYRFSGDPWVRHLLEVTNILLDFKPDEDTIIAALMHDVMETSHYEEPFLEKLFGHNVLTLLHSLQKLNHLQIRDLNSEEETLRRLFLAVAGDLRVVLIRFADRLDNMRTLDYVQESKRRNIAYETLKVFVPIAARLGIYGLKGEMEDLCFKYLHPQAYVDFQIQLEKYMKQQEKVMEHIQNELKLFLLSNGIEAKVEGRIKNLYSIYKKLKKKNSTSISEIFDIFALRVIVPTRFNANKLELTDHLYNILGLIHSRWTPLLARFKDYVALPKPNGYRSLHVAVLGLTPKPLRQPTEIQIRSQKMHEEADYGLAAHWLYKELSLPVLHEKIPQNDWLSGLERVQRNLHSETKLLEPFQVNIFQNRIFVLTPNGQVKDLPSGSTPIDFAYAVHTDVGHRCYSAKVNGAIVPLDYQLKNGDSVEIVTQKSAKPKAHWLSTVKTSLAKSKIKHYLKGFDVEKTFEHGKETLNVALEHSGHEKLDEDLGLLKHYDRQKLSLKERRKIIEEIGLGTLQVGSVLKNIDLKKKNGKDNESRKANLTAVKAKDPRDVKIFIAGEADVPYKFSLCCKPVVGNPIVAYVGRGKALRIHHESCKLLRSVDRNRTLEASWSAHTSLPRRYPANIQLEALDRVGLLRDIADTIASFHVNILDFSRQEKNDNFIKRHLTVEVNNEQQLRTLLDSLRHIRNVLKVETHSD